jgi:hypothetical protein
MGELDSGERDRRRAKALEAQHRRAPLLDGTMVLLDHVVEIMARPDLHVLPATIFSRQ